MTTIFKSFFIVALSFTLCRLVYASDAFSTWINSASGVHFFAPLAHTFGSIGPEDDENAMLVAILGTCSLLSVLFVKGAGALIKRR
jgi:hypothetical protein